MVPDDESENANGFLPPLPPEDRLWRHPSELRARPDGSVDPDPAPSGSRPPTGTASRNARHRIVLVSAAAVVVVALGLVAAVGPIGTSDSTTVDDQAVGEPPPDPTVATALAPALARLDISRGDEQASATAVVYRSDGHLLTTAPSITEADILTVTLADGRNLPGTLIGRDPVSGVAVVKVEAEGLTAAVLADYDVAEGEPTMAVSLSADPTSTPSAESGVITGTGWRVDSTELTRHGLIRAALASSPPSRLGAVLCNGSGAVVGLLLPHDADRDSSKPENGRDATAGATATTATAGATHFATPIGLARRAADDLVSSGSTNYGWLGVQGNDLDGERVAVLGQRGVTVEEVTPGGPADRAGLRAGDVVTGINDQPVRSMSALAVTVRDMRPGDVAAVSYARGAERGLATVTLADAP